MNGYSPNIIKEIQRLQVSSVSDGKNKLQKNKNMPRIVILMPMVWGIRNVIHSGVLRQLVENGTDVFLLMKELDRDILESPEYRDFSYASGCEKLIESKRIRPLKGRSFLKKIIFSAFSRRNKIGSYFIYRDWSVRNGSFFERLKQSFIEIFGYISQPGLFFFRLYHLYDRIFRFEHDLQPVRNQLVDINPTLIWSTVNVDQSFERAYMLVARDLGIPVVNSILSFDNLTSKPAHLIYDHYLVWSNRMKEQLLRFYPQVSAENISVTGTPQFDFHCHPEFHWPRSATLARLRLPRDAQYFLYACSHEDLAPQEPELVLSILREMQSTPNLKDCWLVVRTHPLDDWQRWKDMESLSNRVVLSKPWTVNPDSDGWALPIKEDQTRLISSIIHAEACVNIASTTTLDAAILDRPIIGLYLDREATAPQEILYQEYDADHYSPLVKTGGLQLARTWENLLELMQDAVEKKDELKNQRALMVREECGEVDGKAASRVVDVLIELVNARVEG